MRRRSPANDAESVHRRAKRRRAPRVRTRVDRSLPVSNCRTMSIVRGEILPLQRKLYLQSFHK
jgi:hypothetical protein